MIKKMPAATPFPRTIEEYAARIAAWASYQLKIDEGEAARLVNAFASVVERAWSAGGVAEDASSVARRVVSHVRGLAESMQTEGRVEIAQKLNRLYAYLAFPRLRKRKQPMPEIP